MSCFEPKPQHRPELTETKETDICIIGAGIAGLNLAYLLAQSNKKVIILEKNTLGSGQSGKTTAKITCLPGFFYHDLIERIGMESTHKVARMMRRALQTYAEHIFKRQLDCDFERLPFILLSNDTDSLEKEAKALHDLGFSVETGITTDYFPDKSGIQLDNQAQFDAGKWMNAISKELEIYEHSPVIKVDQKEVFTPKGKVKAEHIVFCDHFPFINVPGFYFMKMHQERSHFLALSHVKKTDAMYYCADEPIETLRFVNNTALYGGFSHPTGQGEDDVLEKMKSKALQRFENSEIIDQWSAQDCMTLDQLPYAGQFSSQRPFWYVATGFNKWGMIYSMLCALLIHDQILGIDNPDAEPFDSLRSIMNTPLEELKQMSIAIKGYMEEWFTLPYLKADDLKEGEGGIIDADGISVGLYKDTNGSIYTVSTRCPHLKCQLSWNKAEKTWDCPCHGSRYDCYGSLIDGPAETRSILLHKK